MSSLVVAPVSMVAINHIYSFSPALGDAEDDPESEMFTVSGVPAWSVTSSDSWIVCKVLSTTQFSVSMGQPNSLGFYGRAFPGTYTGTVTVTSSYGVVTIPVTYYIGYGDSLDNINLGPGGWLFYVFGSNLNPNFTYFTDESGILYVNESGDYYVTEG